MPRKSEGKRKLRADLESAVLAMVDAEEELPVVVLRIKQAIRRSDMGPLLGPALDGLERVARSVGEAKAQVSAAASQFEER
jgi:hypothetical protein